MTREEAIKWLKVISTKEFGWDEFALQESQREIRERCEQGVREAIDMAIEALKAEPIWITDRKPTESGELVRCKDCRHYKKINPRAKSGMCYKDIVASAWNDDGFCSRGERND